MSKVKSQTPKMSEEAYSKKVADLQRYIPFLENMICQLKDPKWKPREAQLNKMESLYQMITDTNKKWKYETLLKCEEVIIKLQTKVKGSRTLGAIEQHPPTAFAILPNNPEGNVTHTVDEIMNALKFNNARAKLHKVQEEETPKSPSPTPEVVGIPHEPKIIPVEPTTAQSLSKKFTNIIDPNELSTTWDQKLEDRYTKERPDIYSSAAKSLSKSKLIFDRLGPSVPQKPLLTDDDLAMLGTGDDILFDLKTPEQKEDAKSIDLNLKITPRIVPVPPGKPKTPKLECSSNTAKKDVGKEVKAKPVVAKSTCDIFGSLLSSIDHKILEEGKKIKKKDDYKHIKDHKESKEHKEHHHKHRKDKTDKDRRLSTSSSTDSVEKDPPIPKLDEAKTQEDQISSTVDVPIEKPVRLADKYHPKPRSKPSSEEVESTMHHDDIKINRDPRRRSPPLSLNIMNTVPKPVPSPISPPFYPTTPKEVEMRVTPQDPRQFPLPVPPPEIPPKPYPSIFGGIPRNQYETPQFQQNTFEPVQNRFEPAQNRFEPAQNRFEPVHNRFEPAQNRFEPVQNRFEPVQNRFEPAQNRFEPTQNRFDPRSNRFDSNRFEHNRFEPQTNRFEAQSNRFPPVANNFEPVPNRFESQLNRFEPAMGRYDPRINQFDLRGNPIQNNPPVQKRFEPVPNTLSNFEPKPLMRKSFNPFEPLDAEKEEVPAPVPNREFGYNRGYNRGRFDRGRFDRNRPPKHEDRRRDWRFKRDSKHEERPRSREGENKPAEEETFTSPLECLYSNPKPAVKGAMQNFRIPKKVRPEEKNKPEPPPPVKDDAQEELPLQQSKRRNRIKVFDDSDNESEPLEKPKSEKDTTPTKTTSPKPEEKIPQNEEILELETKTDATPQAEVDLPKTEEEKKIVEEEQTVDQEEEEKPVGRRRSRRAVRKKAAKPVVQVAEQQEEEVSPRRILRSRTKLTSTSESSITEAKVEPTPPRRRSRAATAAAKALVEEEKPEAQVKVDDKLEEETTPLPEKKVEKPVVEDIKLEEEMKPKAETKELEVKPDLDDKKPVTEEALKLEEKVKDEDLAGPSKVVTEVNEIQKVRLELLEEVKNDNLTLDDQGVLQFILKNYRKIKKIFKSDSSDEEGDSDHKKKKKTSESKEDDKLKTEEIKTIAEEAKTTVEQTKTIVEDTKIIAEEDTKTIVEEESKTVAEEVAKTIAEEENKTIAEVTKSIAEETKTIVEDTKTIAEEDEIKTTETEKKTKTVVEEEEEVVKHVEDEDKPVVAKRAKGRPKVVEARGRGRLKKNVAKKGRVTRRSLKPKPSKKPRRSELDKLHDDIKEMLMGGEIMSTSGKRTCTIAKEDQEEMKEVAPLERAPEPPVVKTNLRVVLGKIDIEKEEAPARAVSPEEREKAEDVPPVLEKSEGRKKVLKRKKINRWATGFIQKKAKRKLSTTPTVEEEGRDLLEDEDDAMDDDILVEEHEKSYFFSQALRYDCRLCNFKGRMIVHHYKNNHPESEVLISRLQPQMAEDLIKDAIAKRDEYSLPVTTVAKRAKSSHKCPFCFSCVRENQENFYYHLTSHTGEYRFACSMCPFRTSTSKCVRVHLCQMHNKAHNDKVKILYPQPQIGRFVFGYICSVCNFIQLSLELVEEHSMVYHPGTPQIYKINLSLPLEPEKTEVSPPVDSLTESIEAVANGTNEDSQEKIIPATVKELNVFDLMSEIQEDSRDDVEEEEEPEQEEEQMVEEQEEQPPTSVQLAAFMCDSDLNMEDEHQAEHDKRMLMMKEINESFKPTRTSMADKLQIKLVNEEKLASVPEIPVEIPAEKPAEEVTTPTTLPALVLIEKPKKLETEAIFKKVDVMSQKKDNISVSNIINRLQEKLLPPLLPFRPENPLDNILEIGPIRVTRKPKSCTFNCKIPHCVFITDDERVFATHCAVTHKDFVYVFRDSGKCDVCTVKFEYEGDFVTVFDVYTHMKTCHKEFFEFGGKNSTGKAAATTPVVTVTPVTPASPVVANRNEELFSLPHDVPNLLSQTPDKSGPKFPFVITSVTSLATQRKTYPPSPKKEPTILNIKQSAEQQQVSLLKSSQANNPVIPSVPSLAIQKSPESNVLADSPIRLAVSLEGLKADGQKRRLVLRDIPLRDEEKVPRKSPEGMNILLRREKNNALYKCPKASCIYTTTFVANFRKHLSSHRELMKVLVPCLYCDYKVFYGYYIVHLEVRHGHCLFGCAYCFYRTTCEYFVQRHQKDEHPGRAEDVLHLSVTTYSNGATNEQPIPQLKDVLGNYICKQEGIAANSREVVPGGCEYQTAFFEEYLSHGREKHGAVYCAAKVMADWIAKGVGPFQCRYCVTATETYNEMGSHQAKMHYLKQPCFYYRKFVASFNAKFPEDLCYDTDEHLEHMIKLPDQKALYDSYTSSNPTQEKTQETADNDWSYCPEVISDDSTEREINEQLSNLTDQLASFDEPEILTGNISLDEIDPLSFDDVSGNFLDETKDSERSFEDVMPIAAVQLDLELSGEELYKCNCGRTFEIFDDLKGHLSGCAVKPYLCVHCGKEKKTVLALAHHYKEHGRKRFKCSLCLFKHWQQQDVRLHMKQIHSVSSTIILPAVLTSKKVNPDTEDFVLRPKQTAKSISDINVKVTGGAAGGSVQVVEESLPKVFGPNEISKLPRQPIYPTAVKCAICAFETKVKSNMERHLQMHAKQSMVPPGSAPVNPVPCLENNEKMFDKMVNLALSSHTTGRMGGTNAAAKVEKVKEDDIPVFVPLNNRFVCGADDCRCQCLEESMLRRHLLAFHSQETVYKCVHCNDANIQHEKTINIDQILKHLKLHEAHLYQCGHCTFFHNLRHKIERHLSDKHPEKPQTLMVIRETVKDVSEGVDSEAKTWRCGICKFRCSDISEVRSHVGSKHNVDCKYQCALCPVRSDDDDDFTRHFDTEHEGQKVDFIVSYYKEDEAVRPEPEIEFNTTPLWQRNNKTVKHIRGILLDDVRTSPVKKNLQKIAPKAKKIEEIPDDDKKKRKKSTTPAKIERKNSSDVEFVPIDNTPILIEDDEIVVPPPENKPKISVKNITILRLPKLAELAENLDEPMKIDDIIAEAIEEERPQRSAKLQAANRIAISMDETPTQAVDDSAKKKKGGRKSKGGNTESPVLMDESSFGSKESLSDATDLIEIMDEEDALGKRKRARMDLTLKEIARMSRAQLLDGNFVGTYGPYGSPWDGRYKCPLCEKFMSSSAKEFTHHLYQEPALQLPFQCNSCKFTAVTEDFIKEHVVSMHDNNSDTAYSQLHLDKQIEGWIHKLISFQTRILNLEKEERKDDPPSNDNETEINKIVNNLEGYRFVCRFCDYGCNNNSDMRKHEPRHMEEKPFKCGYCNYECMYKSVAVRHIRRMHKDLPEKIIEANLTDGVLVYPKTTRTINQKKKVADLVKQTQRKQAVPEGESLKCYYCEYKGTVTEQTAHMSSEHPDEIVRIFRYKCDHCSEAFVSLVTLNNHFFNDHPGLSHSFTSFDVESKSTAKYACTKCDFRENTIEDMHTHVRSHFILFQCPYCTCGYSVWRDAAGHVEEKHSEQPVAIRYMILLEDEIEEIMSWISTKMQGKPSRAAPRKRKLDDAAAPSVDSTDFESSSPKTVFMIDDSP